MVAIRLCVGCGEHATQREMLRCVNHDGKLVVDDLRNLPGRGAWLHRDSTCFKKALQRKAFMRALRMSRQLDTTPLENRLENTMDN